MEVEKVDALIVCGNQYAGFEGAVRYTSGFEIVHAGPQRLQMLAQLQIAIDDLLLINAIQFHVL